MLRNITHYIYILVRWVVGLPLVYLGVALLVLHLLLPQATNSLLIIALSCEIIGVIAHYHAVKHSPKN